MNDSQHLINSCAKSTPPVAKRLSATLLLTSTLFAAPVAWSDAVLLDGTVLTPTAEIFVTEGPIWNIDTGRQEIEVVGKTITIPATVDGVELPLNGSLITGSDGNPTPITASSFDLLSDVNAAGDDGTGTKRGATRSLYSTSEARRLNAPANLDRNPATQQVIEANYFAMTRGAYAGHAAILPADFLQRAGIDRDDDADGALEDVYPALSGGTLKSAGRIYRDGSGNRYLIPDADAVIELSENVVGGTIRSAVQGAGEVPDSFVIDDLLVIFNQDPRFGAEVIGLGGAPIPRSVFFSSIAANPNAEIVVVGHLVSEHVMFAQDVETDFIDPNSNIQITAERFRFDEDKGQLRFRGTVDKPDGVNLVALLSTNAGLPVAQFDIDLVLDIVTGAATYTAREDDLPGNFDIVTLEARSADTGEVLTSEAFIMAELLE
ncbi:MAG: hypothetical protein V7752_05320 [Halopseudomonas sp.]